MSAESAEIPANLQPMNCEWAKDSFDSPEYIFEACRPGIRALAFAANGRITLQAQNALELSEVFREIRRDLRHAVREDGTVLDGVITPATEDGIAGVPELMRRVYGRAPLRAGPDKPMPPRREFPATYEVFDILYKGGHSTMGLPLSERKALLAESVSPAASLRIAHWEPSIGVTFHEAALRLGMAGSVAKRIDSVYEPGKRSRAWLKIKTAREAKAVVGGYTLETASRKGQVFGSLLLGAFNNGRLIYVGSLSGGFQDRDAAVIQGLLNGIHTEGCPFEETPAVDRLFYWCEPRVVVQAVVGEISGEGRLRFPIFKALRPDIDPLTCTLEEIGR